MKTAFSDLTQDEADRLLALEKHRCDAQEWDYPCPGEGLTIPLMSADARESFLLDVRRARIDLAKGSYQTRGRRVAVLARLDFGSRPHRNPDGGRVGTPHLHVYREGFEDRWAIAPPSDKFQDLTDTWLMLEDFMRYCNIADPPAIQPGLFT